MHDTREHQKCATVFDDVRRTFAAKMSGGFVDMDYFISDSESEEKGSLIHFG